MCRVLGVHRSGFYAWLKVPVSPRARKNACITSLMKKAWLESGCVYGYRKLHDDLLHMGEDISPNRTARLAQKAGIKAQVGYRRKPGHYGKNPSVVAENKVARQFAVTEPNTIWVTDITYVRTYEGWSYLAVVIDLFSRRVVGWSIQQTMQTELVLSALLSAVWRRKPKNRVIIHSDQGSQCLPVRSGWASLNHTIWKQV